VLFNGSPDTYFECRKGSDKVTPYPLIFSCLQLKVSIKFYLVALTTVISKD
jgi:hypothetical protein